MAFGSTKTEGSSFDVRKHPQNLLMSSSLTKPRALTFLKLSVDQTPSNVLNKEKTACPSNSDKWCHTALHGIKQTCTITEESVSGLDCHLMSVYPICERLVGRVAHADLNGRLLLCLSFCNFVECLIDSENQLPLTGLLFDMHLQRLKHLPSILRVQLCH